MRVRRTLPPAAVPLGFQDIWNGFKGFLAGRQYVQELERDIREYFGVKHVFLTSSGKASLYPILKTLKSLRPERSDVLIPAYTCFSVPSAIVAAGLNVALCDIDKKSFDFDRKSLCKKITENTLCVIPDHLFGIPSRLDDLIGICRKKDVFVLEDAAQAMGGKSGGRFLGTVGDAGFFSLGRGKAVTCGSGGIIVTNSDGIGAAIKKEYDRIHYPSRAETLIEWVKAILLNIFIRPCLYWVPASMPFLKLGSTLYDTNFPVRRLSSMQAGLFVRWRPRLAKAMSIRKDQAGQLNRRLNIIEPSYLSAIAYVRFPVILDSGERKKLISQAAEQRGLGITRMYTAAVNEIPQIAHHFSGLDFPSARFVADRLITLPLHQYVNDRDRDEIVRLVAPALRRSLVEPGKAADVSLPTAGLSIKGRSLTCR